MKVESKKMLCKQLREKSAEELQANLLELMQAYFKLRLQKISGQLSQTHLLQQTRRNIARIRMVLAEKTKSV